jgi:hypothetical protein
MSTSRLFAAVVVLCASSALADWSAALRMETKGGPLKERVVTLTGKAFGRDGQLRFDTDADLSMLLDAKAHTFTRVMVKAKRFVQTDMELTSVDFPSCTKDTDACLKGLGYKKTGSEKIDGHPCDLWTRDRTTNGHTAHLTIARPRDLKEVPFLRSVHLADTGTSSSVTLSGVTVGPVPDDTFTVPADFKPMGNGAVAPGGAVPEEMRQKILERLQGTPPKPAEPAKP